MHHARNIFVAVLFTAGVAFADSPGVIEVRLDGIDGPAEENVRATLSIVRYSELAELNEAMVQRMHGRAKDEIRQALAPFGYYEVTVSGTLEPVTGGWRAHYLVDPGPPVRVRDVDVRVDGPGSDHPDLRVADLPRTGQPLFHPDYEGIKQALRGAAYGLGYLDARFTTAELRVSVAERAADMVVHLATGERYSFGEVTLEQDVLDEDFLRRYLQFSSGDPFNRGDLLALQYALSDSQYFSMVEVEADPGEAVDRMVPVTVRLQPAARHRYSAGVGYGTDTGPRFTAGWENRRVNARGHRLRSEATLSEVLQSITARYMVPLRNPVHERLVVSTGYAREEVGDLETERADLLLAWTARTGAWQRTVSSRVLSERNDLGGGGDRITQLVPGIEWSYTGGDSGRNPRNARGLSVGISGSNPALGAPVGYLRVLARGRAALPLGERDRLLLRAELGAISSADADRLPATERFFAGGDYSVRGYRYQSLGPTDADGNVIGGRFLATFGIEWEHWITDSWGLGVFADYGNAFNDRPVQFNTGAGVGLRWRLPFAVFALDLAHPFDDPGGRGVRVHLNLGGEW